MDINYLLRLQEIIDICSDTGIIISQSTIMRLDHYLSAVGLGSRSDVKKLISKGRIAVDGAVCKDAGTRVDELTALVAFDDNTLTYREYVYFMLNKPKGVISASRKDMRSSDIPCVIDLIKEEQHRDLFPVGRLDKDTVGLLLITDDGALAHDLLSPRKHVDKEYYVELRSPLSEESKALIESGIDIGDDTPTLPCTIEMLSPTALNITIHEGRFHEIKRMFAGVNNEVIFLKRFRMGTLLLDKNLKSGEYRALTDAELKEFTGHGSKAAVC